MRWIIVVIGALFLTACGGVNSSVEVSQDQGDRFELSTQASIDSVVKNEYNLLINHGGGSNAVCKNKVGAIFTGTVMASNANNPVFVSAHGSYCIATVKAYSNAQVATIFSQLDANSNYLAASRNVRYGLDSGGGGAASFDPTCDQLTTMDSEAEDMEQIDEKDFEGIVVDTQSTESGNGVHIAIIGSGLGTQDDYSCQGAAMVDHDNHIAEIVNELVPNAVITGYDACDSNGVCLSNKIGAQLLNVRNQQHNRQVVNLSLGGPLEDKTHRHIMKFLMKKTFFVASAGNGGIGIDAHYPASYAQGSAGDVANLMAVAAYGFDATTGDMVLAKFNTDGVATIAAPGVNLCPDSVVGGRCSSGDVGISGTSFATSYVTAVGAMFMDEYINYNLDGRIHRNLVLSRDAAIPNQSVRAVKFY